MQDIQEDYLHSRKRIFSATVIVIIVTLLSKISGLVRDQWQVIMVSAMKLMHLPGLLFPTSLKYYSQIR